MLFIGSCLVASPALADPVALKPLVDVRLRHEHVEEDDLPLDADAVTLRVRAGLEASQGRFAALVQAQGNLALLDDYFDGLSGDARRPIVPDPQNVALYRAQLQYRSAPLTLTAGRQVIALDDQRFVGSVPFRQNAQTFDAVRAEVVPAKGLKADVSYASAVRTVWGTDGFGARQAAVDGDKVLANVSWASPIGTLTAFGYWIDQDEAAVQGFRMSSRTFGAQLAGSEALGKAKLEYRLRHARQSDLHRNPNNYSASYYLADLGLDLRGPRFGVGCEVLGADDGRALTSFQTPLGSNFAFQGWVNKFLVTPPDGVRDLYASAGWGRKAIGRLKAVSVQAIYHRFESDRLVRHYGDEIDFLASARLGRTTASVRYADYRADRFSADARKLWLQLDWTI